MLFVRHAESLNNHLKTLHLFAGHDRLRFPDPALSAIGNLQLKHVGLGITRKLCSRPSNKPNPPIKIRVAVSPMQRALLTAYPIVEALTENSPSFTLDCVEIVPFLFEKGGCYSEKDGEGIRAYPGLTSSQAQAILPSAFIADPADMEQGWWKSNTRETDEELEHRIARTVAWIRRCACDNFCDILILVTHEGFGSACIRDFLKCERENLDWLYNASFSCLTLTPIHPLGDGEGDDCHQVHAMLDYLNCVEHLPLETIT